MDPIFGFFARLGYDFLKFGISKGMQQNEADQFKDVFDKTLNLICRKYDITKTDLEAFLKSDEIEKELYSHEDMDLNINKLSNILMEYINLPQEFSYDSVLTDLFQTMHLNVLNAPLLKEYLNNKRFYILRKEQKLTHHVAIENREILEQILMQTKQLGITLNPDDFENNIDFLKKIAEILKEDPYYIHDINLSNGKIMYKLIPKNERAQELEPIHFSFTMMLKEKDGKIISLEEMIEESSKTGKPIVINSDSIKEVSIYRGNKPLYKNDKRLDRIELRPIIPKFPVKIFVPGSDSFYDVVLQLEQRKENSIIVSNQKQDMPIKFKFEFANIGSNATNNYNINVNFKAMDVVQSYTFLKFIHNLKDSKHFVMKDLKTGKVILNAQIKEDFAECTIDLNLIKKLAFIQEVTGIVIPMPLSVTGKNIYDIEETYLLLRDKKIERESSISNLQINILKEYAQSFLEKIDADGLIKDISIIQSDYSLRVLAAEIPIKEMEFAFSCARTEKSKAELERELNECKEDIFPINIKPLGKESIIIALK